jgi:hypothetical protein
MPTIYYTYLWLREESSTFPAGTPYYVGKGSGKRAFIKDKHHHFPPQNSQCILIQEWPSEGDAYEAEKFLISFYGRIDNGTGCLRNLTDGGENPPKVSWLGRKHSPETVEKIREILKNRPAEINAKIRQTILSKPFHPAMWRALEKMQAAKKGVPHTDLHKSRISIAHLGKPKSPEHRQHLSEAAKKRNLPRDPVTGRYYAKL